MMMNSTEGRSRGYSITEVVLAMAVAALALPLTLGLVVAGGVSSRDAERETRAVITARSVYEEVRRAFNGNSEFVDRDDLPWGTGPTIDPTGGSGTLQGGAISSGGADGNEEEGDPDWLILELNREGEIIGQATSMFYEDAWEGLDSEVVALAAVRGGLREVGDAEVVEGVPLRVFRMELRIETPARASSEDRDRTVFFKSDSLR